MDATGLEDDYVTCPYDKSHRLQRSKIQIHLVKCRRNHTCDKSEMLTCPYDATHVFHQAEYQYHINNCRESGKVVNFIQSMEPSRSIGAVPIDEVANVYVPPMEENWDDDPPVKTYDPISNAREKGVLIPENCLSKAKKKQFKNAERTRHQNLEHSGVVFNPAPKNRRRVNKNEISETNDEEQIPLRLPRTEVASASISSNSNYTDKSSNSTSTNKASISSSTGNYSTQENNAQALFEAILAEAEKKTNRTISQASNYSINFIPKEMNAKEVNIKDLGNLHISSIEKIQKQLNVVKELEANLESEKAKIRDVMKNF